MEKKKKKAVFVKRVMIELHLGFGKLSGAFEMSN